MWLGGQVQDVNEDKVFIDRIDFEETLADIMADDPQYENLSDEDFDATLEEKNQRV